MPWLFIIVVALSLGAAVLMCLLLPKESYRFEDRDRARRRQDR
jgi:nitrogen fixation-related uncharacterized protein